ncbi:MAG: alpha-1,2-fucosyltransferase [Lachnospiraceae bacterium]|nr:alpha-1,2-fucosyltransferase [Lachnospiraceae bacterium]
MKVVALIGGLGSQMFKYAFYLALQEETDQECLIDTTFFLQRDSWNGYELDKLFGINEPDIKDRLRKEQLSKIIEKKKSYIDVCIEYLTEQGDTAYYFLGTKSNYPSGRPVKTTKRKLRQKFLFLQNTLGVFRSLSMEHMLSDENAYFDEYFNNSDELFAKYKSLIKKTFVFPPFEDQMNLEISQKMASEESVALHIRRTDHMMDNKKLFQNGFFEKSVHFIKEHAERKTVFYIFSDDLSWCRDNLAELGLDQKDEIIFVDWNTGTNSFRDMQLMMYCQHNVVPISSFSWWGYYLSDREKKIVCAPKGYWLEIENHF